MNQALKDQRVQELIALYNNGDIKECLLKAKKVAKIYPEEPFVFNLIGVVSASIGSYDEAIESYKRALKINPNYFEVYNNLGIICLELKQYSQAEIYYNRALEIRPNYSSALTNLGWVEYLNNKVNIAIDHTVKAHKMNPEDPVSNYNLGLYYLKIKKVFTLRNFLNFLVNLKIKSSVKNGVN